MRLRAPAPLAAAAFALALAAALTARPVVSRAEPEDAPLDYLFYKERVAPWLHQACGECHAEPRKRSKVGRFFLKPAPGRRMRERFQERNFETVLRFVEPGDPSASILLLKALGPARGGVSHEGGALLNDNTPEYGALVDWINGAKRAPEVFTPPASPAGQPDFLFFYKRIEPVLLAVCAECHAGRGHGRMRVVTHERGEDFPLEDHYENYQTVLQLLAPGKPDRSRFLLKPLALADGGIKHRGGDRITKDSVNYESWTLFIQGERGPPLEKEGAKTAPRLTAEGLVVQAEDCHFEDDVEDVEETGAHEYYVARPGALGGRVWTPLEVVDAGAYELRFRVRPGTVPMAWGLGDDAPRLLPLPTAEETEGGYALTGPRILLDGDAPLEEARGGLELHGEVLRMDGRQDAAAWLSPSTARNAGCAATVKLADEEEGGDDAWLLFDMQDVDNGKFAGLSDGGRRFVMGVIEGGVPRVLAAAVAPPPAWKKEQEPRQVKVETFGGVAVGSLDGKPLGFLNLSNNLGRGRFGVLTHGLATVHRVAALEEYEVYAVTFRAGPVVHLPAGALRLFVELPPGSGDLDEIVLRPSGG